MSSVQVPLARTADTAPYVVGDAIGIDAGGSPGSAVLLFAGIGAAGSHIVINGVDLIIGASSGTMSSYRLHLYSSAPDALVDNAAWDLSSANDRAAYLGYIDTDVVVDVGATLQMQRDRIGKHVKLVTADLYAIMTTINAYTPASGTVHLLRLTASQL